MFNNRISGVDRDFSIEEMKYKGVYQISAPIAPGNSGGPLVSQATGEAIGINSAGSSEGNIGFSIPLYQIISMVEEWTSHPNTKLAAASSSVHDGQLSNIYTKQSFAEDAEYLVGYFYECLNAQDYVTAYSLLGDSWQSNTAYEAFRNGYLHTLSTTITDMQVQATSDTEAKITAIIEAEENIDDKYRISTYKVSYTIKLENEKIKLVKGKGEKL